MWIFDSSYRGSVHLWARDRGITSVCAAHPESFFLHLKDPHAHGEMIEALECRYRTEEARFKTIYGPLPGYRICAGRSVAEKIEKQTRYGAELYNVDVRRDQQYLAERDLFPCGEKDESRFSPDFDCPLRLLELKVSGNPTRRREIRGIEICGRRAQRLEGCEKTIISDLMELIRVRDPDVILFPDADIWTGLLVEKAGRYAIEQTISRSGFYRSMAAKSYWSYGRTYHKDGALIPDGRVLIDTSASFAYREGGLQGILLASRLSGLPPNLAARFTPGTLISSYEVYEALRRGLAVPWRKRDAECVRGFGELKEADRGGMMFQPEPGLYEQVGQLDFTSLYPSIIVKYNLSPETLAHPEKAGFLSGVISPLLSLRIETKRRKKIDENYAGLDSILKWMLVTCFGYTGYRNAKFGQIQVHEKITAASRELLLQTKEIAEGMGLEVLHGIVDCLWVKGGDARRFKEAVEKETGILTELDEYDWIAFLPMTDGSGAYNRYFGRLGTGKVKVRGVMARRQDTPDYVRRMQNELFEVLGEARSYNELHRIEDRALAVRKKYLDDLENENVSIKDLAIRRRVGALRHSRRCAEASALQAYARQGIALSPGMQMSYVVKDAAHWDVEPEEAAFGSDAGCFDAGYYGKLLEKAWSEVAFVFS
jgi:DNA polymerase I